MTPDVVVVTIDTLRADHVGCYGSKAGVTPRLDALCAGGVSFSDASTTAPLTLPAHTSILSGQWVHQTGVSSNAARVPADLALLPDRLSAAGYATAAFVSGAPVAGAVGLRSHFGTYDDRRPDALGGTGFPPERRASGTAAAAASWIRTAPEPFFAWVHFYDPHDPYTPTSSTPDPYDGEIRDADAGLGAVLDALAAKGASDRTVVIVLGDHGEGLGDHGEPHHGVLLYQATVRVPLIVSTPGVPPGRRTDPVDVVDVVPTVLGRVGLPADPALPGVDLLGPPPKSRTLYLEATLGAERYGWAPLRGVRRDQLKYVDAPKAELYDEVRDPAEHRNLAPGDGSWSGRLPPPLPPTVSSDQAAQLVALGYAAPGSPGEQGPDPKDRVRWLQPMADASAAINAGRFEDAIALLRPVLSADPTNPAAGNDLGIALSRTGHAAEAVVVLKKAASESPADPTIQVDLGYAAGVAGDLATARAAYEAAADLDRSFAAPCVNRAALELRAGDPAAARKWVDEALKRQPGMPEALALQKQIPGP